MAVVPVIIDEMTTDITIHIKIDLYDHIVQKYDKQDCVMNIVFNLNEMYILCMPYYVCLISSLDQ